MVNTTLEEKMRTVAFNVDDQPHIKVHAEVCRDCAVRACVYVCPANLFTPLDDGGILFNYEECFECGACYVACNKQGAIEWSYPRGGYGVTFRET
jgi:ferredoxin like protein